MNGMNDWLMVRLALADGWPIRSSDGCGKKSIKLKKYSSSSHNQNVLMDEMGKKNDIMHSVSQSGQSFSGRASGSESDKHCAHVLAVLSVLPADASASVCLSLLQPPSSPSLATALSPLIRECM